MKTNLPTPNITELRDLHRDGDAMRAARALADEIAKALRGLRPETILAAAQAAHPGESASAAIESFRHDVWDYLSPVMSHGHAVARVLDEANERQKPLVTAASHRTLAISGTLDSILSFIERQSGDKETIAKRNQLRAAGVVEAEIDRIAKQFDPSKLLEQRDELMAEFAALSGFLETRDESKLPADFLGMVPLYNAQPSAAIPLMRAA